MKYKEMRLGDIAEINMGQSPNSNYFNSEGKGIEFLQGIRTFGENYPSFDTYTTQYNKISEKGDILFSVRAPVGKINWSDRKIAIGRGLAALRVLPNFSSKYMYYFLKKIGNQINSISSGTVFSSINKKELANVKILIPDSLKDQEYIGNRLALLDNKIELNSQINDNLLELSKIIFKDFFPNINEGIDTIGNYIKNYDKYRKPLSKKQRSQIPGIYRYIGATSVNDYINKYNFNGIYLLLGEDGTVQDDKGYPILQYIHGKFWPNNHAHVLQGKGVSTEWLYLFFLQKNIQEIVTGAVQKKISQRNLNSLKVNMPNENKLRTFDKFVQPIFRQIRILEDENMNLVELKQQFLNKFF